MVHAHLDTTRRKTDTHTYSNLLAIESSQDALVLLWIRKHCCNLLSSVRFSNWSQSLPSSLLVESLLQSSDLFPQSVCGN